MYSSGVDIARKLSILADAAKYDASCSSSGGEKKNSTDGYGIGSTNGMGICHSYAPDGRCISLLKVLLTNFCTYDCSYCINRKTSNTPRARFSINELVRLTLDFYRRNYIEGLFLSSGIIRNPDYTMEQVIEIARQLREEHNFRGYIHLKTIPEASIDLIERAGKYADRLSINIELPTQHALTQLAPEKKFDGIKTSMARIRAQLDERTHEPKAPRFAPAGQSTQLIVGAEPSSDATILQTSTTLYGEYRLRRVYYSAFSPIPDSPATLPSQAPPLMREHRLYQADWLVRFYGFKAAEITPQTGADADMLRLDIDPKLAWAYRNPTRFPVDLNCAARHELLRVPGLGVQTVNRLLQARRWTRIRLDHLTQMRISLQKTLPFIVTVDHRPSPPTRVTQTQEQMSLL